MNLPIFPAYKSSTIIFGHFNPSLKWGHQESPVQDSGGHWPKHWHLVDTDHLQHQYSLCSKFWKAHNKVSHTHTHTVLWLIQVLNTHYITMHLMCIKRQEHLWLLPYHTNHRYSLIHKDCASRVQTHLSTTWTDVSSALVLLSSERTSERIRIFTFNTTIYFTFSL